VLKGRAGWDHCLKKLDVVDAPLAGGPCLAWCPLMSSHISVVDLRVKFGSHQVNANLTYLIK
jgi:hypothetical protein